MLISLFNYSTDSHGRAVIKRKASKMNGVRISQLNTVMSALWKIENTCEFWEDLSAIHIVWEALLKSNKGPLQIHIQLLIQTWTQTILKKSA